MLPRSWDADTGMASKAAACLGVWWSEGENNIFEVVTCLASTAQSWWSITCPLPKSLCSRWHCPFHILPGLAPAAIPEGPVQRCTSKNPQLRYPSHTRMLLTASLCETQQGNITALLWLFCSSFISQYLVSCRELLVSCRQDVGQRSEGASRPS